MTKTHMGWREARKLRNIRDSAEDLRLPPGLSSWPGELRGDRATITDLKLDETHTSRTVSLFSKVGEGAVVSTVVIVPGEFDSSIPSVRVSQGNSPEKAEVIYDTDERSSTIGFEGLKVATETLRRVRDMQETITGSYDNPSLLIRSR